VLFYNSKEHLLQRKTSPIEFTKIFFFTLNILNP